MDIHPCLTIECSIDELHIHVQGQVYITCISNGPNSNPIPWTHHSTTWYCVYVFCACTCCAMYKCASRNISETQGDHSHMHELARYVRDISFTVRDRKAILCRIIRVQTTHPKLRCIHRPAYNNRNLLLRRIHCTRNKKTKTTKQLRSGTKKDESVSYENMCIWHSPFSLSHGFTLPFFVIK